MLPSILSTLFALLVLTCQAIFFATAASLASPHAHHQHKLRHQHNRHGKHSVQRNDVKFDTLAALLKSASITNGEEPSNNGHDVIEEILKKSLSRRNRSLDNGVIEQQTCQHEDLISCDDYSSGDKECHTTATGMNCCRCKGHLIRKRQSGLPPVTAS
uniref:Uncharacterized protein n=1 Tax=Plectus sambesii TaxID=2011161 RepID=A0A914VJ52_9BILA